MSKQFFNMFNLYTRKQMEDRISAQSKRISTFYRNQKRNNIQDIENCLKHLLNNNRTTLNNWYFSVTPFFDKHQSFYWIVNEVPEIKSGCTAAEIKVINYAMGVDHTKGYLYYDICSGSDENEKPVPNEIKITDIQVIPKNNGIGSYMLSLLDDLARALEISVIIGELSSVDFKDRDAQIRFYSRNGYTIKLREKTNSGSIRKNIN